MTETNPSDFIVTYKLEQIVLGFYNLFLTVRVRKDFLKKFSREDGIFFLTEKLNLNWGDSSNDYRSIEMDEAYLVRGFNEAELKNSILPIINSIHSQLALAVECKQAIEAAKS